MIRLRMKIQKMILERQNRLVPFLTRSPKLMVGVLMKTRSQRM
nr:MAG TPA: hypothetical protein [Bacteriophage sp.]DAR41990.1 MAG TPA: hypothetical protein [Bacteriophage sp.]